MLKIFQEYYNFFKKRFKWYVYKFFKILINDFLKN
jgi:hypothetical protein